jgi:hypothetical protein
MQSYKNHRRMSPLHHYVAAPLLLLYLGYAAMLVVREPSGGHALQLVFALGVFALSLSARLMSLTLQDRLIRLEMEVRLRRVLASELAERAMAALSLKQLVALRFASDAEMPALVEAVLEGEVTRPDDIKKRVKDWQADLQRV